MKWQRWCLFAALLVPIVIAVPALAQIDFTQHMVDQDIGEPEDMCVADINGDGYEDLVATAFQGDYINWYENTGDAMFAEHPVATSQNGAWAVDAEDIDGDGYVDIVGCIYIDDALIWWRNIDGTGMNWEQRFVTGSINSPWYVCAVDMDSDDDIDFVASSRISNYMAWWENDGDENFTFEIIASDISGPNGFVVMDLDDDLDMDVLGAARDSGEIFWLENDGEENFSYHVVAQGLSEPRLVSVCDMDQDGDTLDVLTAHYGNNGEFLWFEYDDGTWTEHSIAQNFTDAWEVCPSDVDLDGDLDVVGSATSINTIVWFENDLPNTTWTAHIIDNTFGGAGWLCVSDVDNDDDEDIFCAGYSSNQIGLYEHMGFQQQPLTVNITPADDPLIVPQGGFFLYNLNINSSLNQVIMAYLWTEATLPNGSTYGPVFNVLVPFAPGMTIAVTNIHQSVPMFAPTGEYSWVLGIGFNPYADPVLSDSFPFTVVEAAADQTGQGAIEWTSNAPERILSATGQEDDPAGVPDAYALSPASPNPFNASTTISLGLPETADLKMAVYNVTGQLVATLVDGTMSAGLHRLAFDGTDLSGGVYFVKASTSNWEAVQKVVLLK